jgi:hypothetical protein
MPADGRSASTTSPWRVGDLGRSLAFYRAALVRAWTRPRPSTRDCGPWAEGHEDLTLDEGGPLAPPIHLPFVAESREQVEGFHREGLRTGETDNGPAGVRTNYSPTYFAATPTATRWRSSGTCLPEPASRPGRVASRGSAGCCGG